MISRLAIHPDLNECVLEDRTLLAYSPIVVPLILTTGGYIVLSTPPGLSSILGTVSGSSGTTNTSGGSGGNGGNMPGSFTISGFGPSTFAIGNNTGFPALSQSRGGASGSVNFGSAVGSGANTGGGGGGAGPASSAGYAGNVSTGYNFALNSQNAYGMSANAVGSVPVHTYGNGTAEMPPDARSGNNPVVNQAPPPGGIPTLGSSSTPPEGVSTHFGNNLLGKKLFGTVPLTTKPVQFNP